MKKILSLVLVFILIFSVGCSSDEKSDDNNTNEEKESVKVDIKNSDELYNFVAGEIIDITRENFDDWEIYYFDITEDGSDEAILVSTYGADWYEKMEIVSVDNGKFERIPSNIYLGKYNTTAEFKDGFLTVITKNGGTGEQFETMDFFVYNGTEVVNVLSGLLIHHGVGAQDTAYTEEGIIDGSLLDFTYTLTKHDELTNKDTVEVKAKYTYDEANLSFNVEPLEIKEEVNNDSSKPEDDYTTNNNAGTEESDFIKLSGLTNEKVNRDQVKYSNYYAVIVPMYSGGNKSALTDVTEVIGSPSQGNLGMEVSFAIFGHLKDIKITYYEGMDSEGETIEVGTLYNSNVNVKVFIPSNDMSYIRVSGDVPTGEGYNYLQFNIDDMRDSSDYDVIMFD